MGIFNKLKNMFKEKNTDLEEEQVSSESNKKENLSSKKSPSVTKKQDKKKKIQKFQMQKNLVLNKKI